MGTVLLFVLLAIAPFILYGMAVEGWNPKKEVIHDSGMCSASVLYCMNKKRKSVAEGKQAFLDNVSLAECPYEDIGKNERYGYLFNQNFHWKTGWESSCPEKSDG